MPPFPGHPSLRTVRLVLPDTALQSVVSLPYRQYLIEVVEPAAQHRVDQLDGLFQRAPVVALELRAKLAP